MLITNDDGNVLNDTFVELASKAKNIIIASGYFGSSQIEEVKPLFLDIVRKGGKVTLIHGMGMWEGIRKSLENSISSLNADLQKHSSKICLLILEVTNLNLINIGKNLKKIWFHKFCKILTSS